MSAGSIPAGAGEPNAYAKPFQQDKVYPRGCGGAYRVNAVDGIYDGLSPRVRGSHWTSPQAVRDLRSIPAGAGEPTPEYLSPIQIKVYPRGCGGA